jgi:peptidoglycan/xylan/chitin deacetylase (PgdA/CDA1 family)
MPITLLYHDVVERAQDDSSGFRGAGAARYKLTHDEFLQHTGAIAGVLRERPVTVPELGQQSVPQARLFTFDDGGISSEAIARVLEARGWRGHFFITTDYIGATGFLSKEQIRNLHQRGHVIGSHSCSHPPRMSWCAWEQLLDEWQRSCAVLADIVAEPVTIASVPGGFYSTAVARAAAQAGIKVLFNSEPTARSRTVADCLILGRYTVYRGMLPQAAAALAAGRLGPRWRQCLAWNVKKAAKVIGGRLYVSLRERLLKRAYAPAAASGNGNN